MDQVKSLPKRTVRESIEYYINNPPENSRVFTIEPEDAKWIEENFNTTGNRHKKPNKIKTFAEHMTAARWGLTGDTLKFSNAGILADGQNRLAACVRAGSPFRTHVVFGIDQNLFDVMDRGKSRDGGDVLTIAGYQNCNTLAAACRWAELIATGRAKQRDTFEPSDILTMLKSKYPTLPEFIPYAMAIHRNVGSPGGLTAAVLYLASVKRPKDWAEFARIWELGGQDKHGGPLKKMLEELTRLGSASQGRIHETVRAALAVIAWNFFVRGTAGTKSAFQWTLDSKFPEMISK